MMITTLPTELLQHFLSFYSYLWRHLYLNAFDPPVAIYAHSQTDYHWKSQLIARVKAFSIFFHGPLSAEHRRSALRTILALVEDSIAAASRTGASENISGLKKVLFKSNLLSNLYSASDSPEDVQLTSQLKSYLALVVTNNKPDVTTPDNQSLLAVLAKRDISRAYVYDLRNYTAKTRWGPFMPDGSVNWVHVEHLVNVVALNVRELPGAWPKTRPPSCLDLSRRRSHDWAGVEGRRPSFYLSNTIRPFTQGTWRRYVCFMDYRDLFGMSPFVHVSQDLLTLRQAFNFTEMADGPRHPKFFKDPRFREATRLIEVKTSIVPIEQLRFLRLPEAQPCPSSAALDRSPLCFIGSSKGVNGNEAAMEGAVIEGEDGVPRWYFMSIYDNTPQWSSCGVQLGGSGSPMGVVGVWTTNNHEDDDPVGPFWLWKVDDNSPTHLMEYT
ncbi:hypothetical protein CVT24_004303 [Panaeolus cyanescens]|uniref:F-box domain-containing protein n=1 Tax=Panaeolus cyanescens TaxID=181874 RepID=A0A409VA59_9AGAR|nr:hypothetical protein CVT24_004303 [Panaeolus cyanescens]